MRRKAGIGARIQAADGEGRKTGRGRFLPAGQTTSDDRRRSPETDGQILRLTEFMYRKYDLKRVYYSSYVPVVHDPLLPDAAAGLLREHRLYQADWLLRFYGFTTEEIAPAGENLPAEYDPKCAWALRNMQYFPVEINRASVEQLLRVPGIGAKGAYKIVTARKYAKLTFEDLKKMRIVLKRAATSSPATENSAVRKVPTECVHSLFWRNGRTARNSSPCSTLLPCPLQILFPCSIRT